MDTSPLNIVAAALAASPSVTQVLGAGGENQSVAVVIGGQRYLVTIRPRLPGESFTLYEMPETCGEKGEAT